MTATLGNFPAWRQRCCSTGASLAADVTGSSSRNRCVRHCPTGALVRVDPIEYFGEIGPPSSFVFRDQNHAVGRNIHKSDPIATTWHTVGSVVTILAAVVLGWTIAK